MESCRNEIDWNTFDYYKYCDKDNAKIPFDGIEILAIVDVLSEVRILKNENVDLFDNTQKIVKPKERKVRRIFKRKVMLGFFFRDDYGNLFFHDGTRPRRKDYELNAAEIYGIYDDLEGIPAGQVRAWAPVPSVYGWS